MTRTESRREWPAVWSVQQTLRDLEGRGREEPVGPYREPTQVSLGEKPKVYRVYGGRGNSAN